MAFFLVSGRGGQTGRQWLERTNVDVAHADELPTVEGYDRDAGSLVPEWRWLRQPKATVPWRGQHCAEPFDGLQ